MKSHKMPKIAATKKRKIEGAKAKFELKSAKRNENEKKGKKIEEKMKTSIISKIIIIFMIIHLLTTIIFAQIRPLQETLTSIYGYTRVIAAIGFTLVMFYAGYKFYFSESEIEKKEMWTIIGYAIVGAVLIYLAPSISDYLAGNKQIFNVTGNCTL